MHSGPLQATELFCPAEAGFSSPAGSSFPTLKELNTLLRKSIAAGNYSESSSYIGLIMESINKGPADSLAMSESFYLIGVYNLMTGDAGEALRNLLIAEDIMLKKSLKGDIFSKTLYNIAVASNYKGDFRNMYIYSLRSYEAEKEIYGESSPSLIGSLSNLITASVDLQDYEQSIEYGNIALRILDTAGEGILRDSELADLYYNMGVCYLRLSDFAKAVPYLEKTEQLFERGILKKDDRYINLLNSMAITYEYMGYTDKSDDYYMKGVLIAKDYNSIIANNITYSYAIKLAKTGRREIGSELLASLLESSRRVYGTHSRNYIEVLKNYAEYLRVYINDYKTSLAFYEECIDYLRSNKDDLLLAEPVYLGYSLTLAASGDPRRALEIIQQRLHAGSEVIPEDDLVNPDQPLLKADKRSLDLLRAKYKILWQLYTSSGDPEYLMASANTSELIISVLEKVRINLSQEESRLILGDRFRDSYISAIRDFDLCYRITGRREYLEKAFEYSERSKVAGLLASTRELKATQFHIPHAVADLEKRIQREISLINARIVEENNRREPDSYLLNVLNDDLLKLSRRRDSLVTVFEKEYPEYFTLKYNTRVIQLDEIPGIAGQKWNYLNYIVSDSMLYIFIANRKHQQIISLPVGSDFFDSIRAFRDLLLSPSRSAGARTDFIKYQKLGVGLYKTLLEPVTDYLISDNLLISPDNILSYLPFEALLTAPYSGDDILYRELDYVIRKYRISYTYSVTFMSESDRRGLRHTRSLVAFAPVYAGNRIIDSLSLNRGSGELALEDLQFARQEAEYITDLMRGSLYSNNEALESTFKREAGKYDIIHLAMHTILNDRFPMHSKMVFYPENDYTEDGLLNTYEVYGLPLKAAMVVLSSCNTGSGFLYSGEGVLSLARGFMYSGSQSVVMTLWEVEDRSGSEIIKAFYRNIRRGKSKTDALRKARMDYLRKASQLGSHPSYWSAQVIYGNNAPLNINGKIPVFLLFVTVLLACITYIYRRRST